MINKELNMQESAQVVINLGTLILNLIAIESYKQPRNNERKKAINSAVWGEDVGIKIINKITEDIPRELYPDWLFNLTTSDIISLALGMSDVDFLHDIFSAMFIRYPQGYLMPKEIILSFMRFFKNLNATSSKGHPKLTQFEKDSTIPESAIVAGVLSSARNKIKGINTIIDAQEAAQKILGRSVSTIKKHCYESNKEGVTVRAYIEKIMKPVFEKMEYSENIPMPTPMECYMVSFLALWGKAFIWTGHLTEDFIPDIKDIYVKSRSDLTDPPFKI